MGDLQSLVPRQGQSGLTLADLEAQRTGRTVFLVLHILGGHVGIPLLLLGIYFTRSVTRHPVSIVFVNWCITWILFSAAYALLLYAGYDMELTPPFLWCVSQASIIYAAGAMVGTATFIFSFYINSVVRRAVNQWEQLKLNMTCTITAVIIPYVIFLIVFCVDLVVASVNRKKAGVHRSSFYCTIKAPVSNVGPGIGMGMVVAASILQVYTLFIVFRHWRFIGKHVKPNVNSVNLSLIIRMSIFTFAAIIGILGIAAFLGNFKGPIPNITLAAFPLLVVMVFGTTKDLLQVWCLWRKESVKPDKWEDLPSLNVPNLSPV